MKGTQLSGGPAFPGTRGLRVFAVVSAGASLSLSDATSLFPAVATSEGEGLSSGSDPAARGAASPRPGSESRPRRGPGLREDALPPRSLGEPLLFFPVRAGAEVGS